MKRNYITSSVLVTCALFFVFNAIYKRGVLKQCMWLAEQAFDGVLYCWPVTALLAALMTSAVVCDYRKKLLRVGDMKCLFPLLGTAVIVYSGAYFANDVSYDWMPFVGLAIFTILTVYTIIRLKRIWKTVSAVSTLILWYSLWCLFVSGMSIAGDWM